MPPPARFDRVRTDEAAVQQQRKHAVRETLSRDEAIAFAARGGWAGVECERAQRREAERIKRPPLGELAHAKEGRWQDLASYVAQARALARAASQPGSPARGNRRELDAVDVASPAVSSAGRQTSAIDAVSPLAGYVGSALGSAIGVALDALSPSKSRRLQSNISTSAFADTKTLTGNNTHASATLEFEAFSDSKGQERNAQPRAVIGHQSHRFATAPPRSPQTGGLGIRLDFSDSDDSEYACTPQEAEDVRQQRSTELRGRKTRIDDGDEPLAFPRAPMASERRMPLEHPSFTIPSSEKKKVGIEGIKLECNAPEESSSRTSAVKRAVECAVALERTVPQTVAGLHTPQTIIDESSGDSEKEWWLDRGEAEREAAQSIVFTQTHNDIEGSSSSSDDDVELRHHLHLVENKILSARPEYFHRAVEAPTSSSDGHWRERKIRPEPVHDSVRGLLERMRTRVKDDGLGHTLSASQLWMEKYRDGGSSRAVGWQKRSGDSSSQSCGAANSQTAKNDIEWERVAAKESTRQEKLEARVGAWKKAALGGILARKGEPKHEKSENRRQKHTQSNGRGRVAWEKSAKGFLEIDSSSDSEIELFERHVAGLSPGFSRGATTQHRAALYSSKVVINSQTSVRASSVSPETAKVSEAGSWTSTTPSLPSTPATRRPKGWAGRLAFANRQLSRARLAAQLPPREEENEASMFDLAYSPTKTPEISSRQRPSLQSEARAMKVGESIRTDTSGFEALSPVAVPWQRHVSQLHWNVSQVRSDMQRMEANILKLLLVNDRISQTDTNRKPQALGKLVNRHYSQQRQDGGVFLAASAGVRSPDHPPLNAKENKRTKKERSKVNGRATKVQSQNPTRRMLINAKRGVGTRIAGRAAAVQAEGGDQGECSQDEEFPEWARDRLLQIYRERRELAAAAPASAAMTTGSLDDAVPQVPSEAVKSVADTGQAKRLIEMTDTMPAHWQTYLQEFYRGNVTARTAAAKSPLRDVVHDMFEQEVRDEGIERQVLDRATGMIKCGVGVHWLIRNHKLIVAGFAEGFSQENSAGTSGSWTIQRGDILRCVNGTDVLAMKQLPGESTCHEADNLLFGPAGSKVWLTMLRAQADSQSTSTPLMEYSVLVYRVVDVEMAIESDLNHERRNENSGRADEVSRALGVELGLELDGLVDDSKPEQGARTECSRADQSVSRLLEQVADRLQSASNNDVSQHSATRGIGKRRSADGRDPAQTISFQVEVKKAGISAGKKSSHQTFPHVKVPIREKHLFHLPIDSLKGQRADDGRSGEGRRGMTGKATSKTQAKVKLKTNGPKKQSRPWR